MISKLKTIYFLNCKPPHFPYTHIMNCRRLISSVIWIVYLLTTQLVVHAFAMHDMTAMHGGMDHASTISQDCVHDHDTHHMQDDLSISSSPISHDMTDCITITKTASKTSTSIDLTDVVCSDRPLVFVAFEGVRRPELVIGHDDVQWAPGWSEFLDNHYGHGIVMIS